MIKLPSMIILSELSTESDYKLRNSRVDNRLKEKNIYIFVELHSQGEKCKKSSFQMVYPSICKAE